MDANRGRRIWAVALTGIPYGIYKLAFGWYAYGNLNEGLGALAMAWGASDVLFNVISLWLPRSVSHCLLSNIGRRIDLRTGRNNWEYILLGLDTLLACSIVAGMIWFGQLPISPYIVGRTWDVAVVCNVLAVGVQQIWNAVGQTATAESAA